LSRGNFYKNYFYIVYAVININKIKVLLTPFFGSSITFAVLLMHYYINIISTNVLPIAGWCGSNIKAEFKSSYTYLYTPAGKSSMKKHSGKSQWQIIEGKCGGKNQW